MESTIFKWLSEQFPLGAVLGIGIYIIWKRYDKFTEKTEKKLEESESRMRSYMENDKQSLIALIIDNTQALKEITKIQERSNQVMECIISEIKDFKESEVYSHYKANK